MIRFSKIYQTSYQILLHSVIILLALSVVVVLSYQLHYVCRCIMIAKHNTIQKYVYHTINIHRNPNKIVYNCMNNQISTDMSVVPFLYFDRLN